MKGTLSALVSMTGIIAMPVTAATHPATLFGASGGTWMATGSLRTARVAPMAVTLPDGGVLVAGGFTSNATLSSTELYNPQTGHWSPTGAMALGRSNATLTLLASGKVLVAGGLTSVAPGVTAKAEIFDPATGRWSSTGKMLVPRANHTATLLQNGDVLVTGGVGLELNQSVGMAGAELYDSTTGTWSRTGTMSTRRERHTATLLADGEVLVSGGNIDYLRGPQGSTELYDPQTGRWSLAGHMTTSRFSQSATALADGTILVAGGSYGDFAASNTLASSDRYDPKSRQWLPTGDMQIDTGAIPTISGPQERTHDARRCRANVFAWLVPE